MFFGLTFEKVIVITIIIGLILGPERLPTYTRALTRAIKRGRDFATAATSRVREEMGPEFDDVDWRQLDPRKYDPRRIIREALLDEVAPAPSARAVHAVANANARPLKPTSELDTSDAQGRAMTRPREGRR